MNINQVKAGQKWRFLEIPEEYSFKSDYSEEGPNYLLDSQGKEYCKFKISRPYKTNSQVDVIEFFREGDLFNIPLQYEVSFLLRDLHVIHE